MAERFSADEGGWNEVQQKALKELYSESGAETIDEKIAVHEGIYGKSNFYGTAIDHESDQPVSQEFVGRLVDITEEQKLKMHEYTYLEGLGLINIV